MQFSRPSPMQLLVLWCIAAAVFAVAIVIPALGAFEVPRSQTPQGPTVTGTVTRIIEERTEQSARGPVRYQRLAVEADGRESEVERTSGAEDIAVLDVEPGDRVLLATVEGPDGPTYYIVDRVRSGALWLLTAAFALVVLAVGRLSGLRSLIGLVVSGLVIMRFIVPGILSGHSPMLIALAGAAVIMTASLYLAHGINRKTTVALAGTTVSLLVAGALASLAVAAARLSGIASEDAATLQLLSAGDIRAEGLLLAGIVIGALGVLDDVTVTQTSLVYELREANRGLGLVELYRRGMNVGRDHIASTVNTLVLAYAGASLPLLMLLATQGEALTIQLNREFIATEIVRTLTGSIGIVAAVPITTALAALVVSRTRRPEVESAPGLETEVIGR